MKKLLLFVILAMALVSFFTLLLTDQSWKGNRELINVLCGVFPFIYLLLFPFLLSPFKAEEVRKE